MNKRILSLVLCFLLLLSLSPFCFADGEGEEKQVAIKNSKDFLAFAESCRLDSFSTGLSVSLEADIDLSGIVFDGVPSFSGRLDGKGHRISGLSIVCDGSAAGLFRYLTESGELKNLHVEGCVTPAGSRSSVGGIVGINSGRIEGCSFSGTVSGSDLVGGIVGDNLLSGIIEDCRSEGAVSGTHFVGGICGENSGVVRSCVNNSAINAEARQNEVNIEEISTDSLISSEAAVTVTDIGGICGVNSGLVRNCENLASVGYKHMGYNIGGIAGSQLGYISSCVNRGSIAGRKEVGGIAGQSEPVSLVEFSMDTLQILQGQLDTLEGLTDRASANAQGGAAGISNQLGQLGGHVNDAMGAIGTLIPGENQGGDDLPEIPGAPEIPGLPEQDNIKLPDSDTITAAQNNLSSAMSGMQSSMNSLMAGVQGTVNTLSNDLNAISNQIAVMSQTLGGAADSIGGSISDVSDSDSEELLTGKTEDCVNYGSVLADMNAGGICGAMAIGNDLDHEADLSISGENSLNFESQLRSVLLRCENMGQVKAGKQKAGGIVGYMDLGLLRECINTGTLLNSTCDYVGGIAGESRGYIRTCSAKSSIAGDEYVGGIAGCATVVTDCRSLVQLEARERYGSILGGINSDTDEENPISGNHYSVLGSDPGAIDRISYAAKASPLPLEDFLALENLDEIFSHIVISFVFDESRTEKVALTPGVPLSAEQVPAVPEKEGFVGRWEGLEDIGIPFDCSIKLVYSPLAATVESKQLREDGRPVLLVSGKLSLGAEIYLERSDDTQSLVGNRTILDSLHFGISGAEEELVTLRYLPPEGTKLNHSSIYLTDDSGKSFEVDYSIHGSYLVFEAPVSSTGLTLVRNNDTLLIYGCIGAAGFCLIFLAAIIIHSKRRKKSAVK